MMARWLAAGMLFAVAARPVLAAAEGLAADSLWDDGKAEVSLYEAREPRYGEIRRFEARMIVVKEDFDREQKVKSEAGPIPGRTLPVLKLNHLRRIPTGTYEYHQMASVFLDRAAWRPIKLTMSHFESCGMTFVEVLPGAASLLHRSHSYWEGEADRELTIPFPEGSLLYDALPLQLRGWDLSRLGEVRVSALPSQISGRAGATTLVPMTLRAGREESIAVPAGTFTVRPVDVERPGGRDRLHFEVAFPHRLIRLETAEGTVYRLRKSLRLDYWNHHREGDQRRLE